MVLSEFFIYFLFFLLLPPPRFPDDNFWPPSRTAPEFKPVTGHGHRKKCIVFRPRATPGWGRGAPQTPPKSAPPPKKKDVFANKKNSVTKNFHPRTTAPPSPQNTHFNPGAIISTPTIPVWDMETHLINRHCQQCMYTSSSLSINVHTTLYK